MHTPGQKYTMQEHKCECLVNTLHDADCFGLVVKKLSGGVTFRCETDFTYLILEGVCLPSNSNAIKGAIPM